MVSGLSHQFLQWNALLADIPSIAPAGPSSNRKSVDLKQVAELFKPDAPETEVALRNTNLSLTLLGSFVHSRAEQSVAVIQASGKAPQRLAPGKEVIQGVRLQAVHPDHVVLVRGGESERLFFPRVMALHSTPVSASQGAAHQPFQVAQLKKLPGGPMNESQKKIKALLLGIKPPETAQPPIGAPVPGNESF